MKCCLQDQRQGMVDRGKNRRFQLRELQSRGRWWQRRQASPTCLAPSGLGSVRCGHVLGLLGVPNVAAEVVRDSSSSSSCCCCCCCCAAAASINQAKKQTASKQLQQQASKHYQKKAQRLGGVRVWGVDFLY